MTLEDAVVQPGQGRVRVKICCIGSASEAQAAVRAGADALGFVTRFATPAGRMTDETLAELAGRVPAGVSRFLLTDRTDAAGILEHVGRVGADVVQVCDHVEPEVLDQVRRHGLARVVAVVHMGAPDPLGYAASIAGRTDGLLLDSGSPGGTFESRGGTGRTHDWGTSAELVQRSDVPVWLAGGLHAGNVRDAIAAVRPFGVDLCSGVRRPRSEGGGLDEDRLAAFMAAVHDAGGVQ